MYWRAAVNSPGSGSRALDTPPAHSPPPASPPAGRRGNVERGHSACHHLRPAAAVGQCFVWEAGSDLYGRLAVICMGHTLGSRFSVGFFARPGREPQQFIAVAQPIEITATRPSVRRSHDQGTLKSRHCGGGYRCVPAPAASRVRARARASFRIVEPYIDTTGTAVMPRKPLSQILDLSSSASSAQIAVSSVFRTWHFFEKSAWVSARARVDLQPGWIGGGRARGYVHPVPRPIHQ